MEPGHQHRADPPLPGKLQHLQAAGGGAGIGEEDNDVPLVHGGDSGELAVGVGDGEKLPGHRGKQVAALLGHDHAPAGAHAQNPGGILKKFHRPKELFRLRQLHGLADGVGGELPGLGAAALDGVRVLISRLLGSGGGILGNFDLKGVEALELEAPAESGDGGLGGAALVGQLGDRHELDLVVVAQDIVRHLPLRGGEMVVRSVNAL